MSALEDLWAAGNQLTSLPLSLSSLSSIRRILLSRNKLKELPEDMGALVSLECLELHGNPTLLSLPPSLSSLSPSLSTLTLDDTGVSISPQAIRGGVAEMLKEIGEQ